jgi:two-component system, NtrC family, sensor histidine kinase HydH
MPLVNRDRFRQSIIALMIGGITVAHYVTSTEYYYLHEVYQRSYYIPILLAAFWYGPVGGVLAAAATSVFYSYHILAHWGHAPSYSFNQFAEILLYHAIGALTGFLARAEKRQRQALEKTTEELQRAYQRIEDSFEQLKQADRLAALGELGAGIAHEIRNPLATLAGVIDIVGAELPPDHPKAEFIRIGREETARLDRIVGEFLAFARPPKPAFEEANLNQIIESTLLLLNKHAEKKGVEILVDLGNLPPVMLDRDQIRQVLLNVMKNGIEAMPQGGELYVRSRYQPSDQTVMVAVEDTGGGIDSAMIDRLFDPFYTSKPGGTGLGLSVSYQLVNHHAGSIRLIPKEGGSTFEIRLPVVQPSSDPGQPAPGVATRHYR